MKKETKNDEINEDKEEKLLNKWLPICTMLGTLIGIVLNFAFDNLMYLGYGICGGILLGTLIACVVSENDEK